MSEYLLRAEQRVKELEDHLAAFAVIIATQRLALQNATLHGESKESVKEMLDARYLDTAQPTEVLETYTELLLHELLVFVEENPRAPLFNVVSAFKRRMHGRHSGVSKQST